MTLPLKFVRRAKGIYVVDQLEEEELVAISPTLEHATWVANGLAGWHKVSLEEYDADDATNS